jgi:hypothetical protein
MSTKCKYDRLKTDLQLRILYKCLTRSIVKSKKCINNTEDEIISIRKSSNFPPGEKGHICSQAHDHFLFPCGAQELQHQI